MAIPQFNHREAQRKANDRILVFNPTEQDYTQRFDGIGFTIPNKNKDNGHGAGCAVVPRYVEQLYIKHMTDLILGGKQLDAIRDENKDRVSKGMKEMDKYIGGEGAMFAEKYKIDNDDQRTEIFKILYRGVVEEYGIDDVKVQNTGIKEYDPRSFEEKMEAELDNTAVLPQDYRTAPEPEVKLEEEDNIPDIPTTLPDPTLEQKKNEAISELI